MWSSMVQMIVFVDSRRRRSVVLPSPLSGVSRVSSMKMLGITVTETLSVVYGWTCQSSNPQLRVILVRATCTPVRSHGLNDAPLQTVYRAVVVIRLTYAISAWWGFTTADDRQRIERFLRRGTRSGFYRSDWPSVETLAEDAADVLFRRVLRTGNHLLYTLLPDKNSHGYNLRHRRHDRTLV